MEAFLTRSFGITYHSESAGVWAWQLQMKAFPKTTEYYRSLRVWAWMLQMEVSLTRTFKNILAGISEQESLCRNHIHTLWWSIRLLAVSRQQVQGLGFRVCSLPSSICCSLRSQQIKDGKLQTLNPKPWTCCSARPPTAKRKRSLRSRSLPNGARFARTT